MVGVMNTEPEKSKSEKEIEFDEKDLEIVEISDDAIEAADADSKKARRQAKKEAKKLLTPEEKKKARRKKDFIFLGGLVTLLLVLIAIPFTRWPILNAVGFRGNLALTVHEQGTNKPISGVAVNLASGQSAMTDDFGHARISQAHLGKQVITLSKTGYGTVTTKVTNGLVETKIDNLSLKVIGIKLDVVIKDWLSGHPINSATVLFGKVTATSDNTGLASIVIPPTDEAKVKLDVSANGYLTKPVETEVAIASREVSLVSAQKDYFISRRDGKFDIFSSNLDGTDQHKIIEATGKENQALLQFTINGNNQTAVLVANRDGTILNNRIVAGIYVIDLAKSTLKKVDEGSDVQLLGWVGSTIVYNKTAPELNYNDPNFTKLQSYDVSKSRLNQIAQTNYLQISLVAQNKVFYLPSDSYRSIDNAVLTSFDVGSGARKTYLADKTLSYGTRASYTSIELQDFSGKNYELQIGTGTVKNIDRLPGSNLDFAINPSGNQVLWSDRRDGQGALLTRSVAANDEKIVTKAGGLTQPVRFIGDNLAVVRVATSQETADYVVDLTSSKMAKIVDVSNVGGNQRGEF
jgi:hypothetical protein